MATLGSDAISDDVDRPGSSMLMRPVWRQNNLSALGGESQSLYSLV